MSSQSLEGQSALFMNAPNEKLVGYHFLWDAALLNSNRGDVWTA